MSASESQPLSETITLKQAKSLIKCLAHDQSLLLLSPPGVGKSDTVVQAAAEAGLPCRSLLGTQIAPEDVSGIPQIVGERSVFCPPRILLPENPEPFCLFLDELPACPPDIQKAFYALLLERRLGEHFLPRGSWVVAAGNRAEDRALVRSISSALVNRVIILNVRVDVKEWLVWAKANGVRSEILSFHHLYAGRADAIRAARTGAVFHAAGLGRIFQSDRFSDRRWNHEQFDPPGTRLWPAERRRCGAVLRHG
jgi:MoxR-like ATPase